MGVYVRLVAHLRSYGNLEAQGLCEVLWSFTSYRSATVENFDTLPCEDYKFRGVSGILGPGLNLGFQGSEEVWSFCLVLLLSRSYRNPEFLVSV